jgi:hypothetical protein
MRVLQNIRSCGLAFLAACVLSACGNGASPDSGAAPPSSPAPPSAPPGSTQPLTLQLSASTYSVSQSAGSVTITVVRSSGSSLAASVSYASSNGTAVSPADYAAVSGTLSWSDGDSGAKTFNVVLGTTPFAGSKTFSVTLSNASGANVGLPGTAVVTINGSVAPSGNSPAAKLAARLGLPSRLLLGLGAQGSTDQVSDIESQGLKVDIFEHYLGTGDWTAWNSPPCDFVCVIADDAQSVGAIPMYTYYQMANDGDGNISVVNDPTFMATYWSRLKLLFQDIAGSKKPALVNFEPDFWGYAERAAPGSDPTKLAAVVSSNPDCATLSNNVAGYAACLIAMARKYAPNAYVGFPPSVWGGDTNADVVAFMNAVGAQAADFIVEQTLDRDSGCFEMAAQPSYCTRSGSGWYWDESNQTHPNFQDHLAQAQAYHSGIGNLPIIWWQTPLGTPAAGPGGSDFHYRDDREDYFLTHPAELTAVGGLAVVFSTGENHQTNISTDGGQFQSLSTAYLTAPVALP